MKLKLKINYFILILSIFTKVIYSRDNNNENTPIEYNNNLATVDKILAIIYHPYGSHLILQSDLTLNIDNITISQEDAIFRKLVEIDAEIMQLSIPDEDIDRHWAKWQKDLNLTQEQILEKIKPFTIEQARQEIRRDLTLQNMIDYRVRSKVIVDKKDIENYCKENPAYTETTYTINQATLKFNPGSELITKIKLKRALELGEIDQLVKWDEPIELKDSQIAQNKSYIKTLNVGSVIALDPENLDNNSTSKGATFIKLASKAEPRLLDHKEREPEVYNLLYRERFEKVLNGYKSKLFGQYELDSNNIYKDPRIAVIKYIG